MLTIPEAARRVGRDPETVRRWIRSGKLRAKKVGTQHVIEEADLEFWTDAGSSAPLPEAWRKTWTGRDQPDWVSLVRQSRSIH